MAITPRARSAASSEASLLSAPRSLNELVTWRFSYLTKTSAPVSAESLRGRQHRRAQHLAGDHAARRLDVGDGDAHRRSCLISCQPAAPGRTAQSPVPLAPGRSILHLPAESKIASTDRRRCADDEPEDGSACRSSSSPMPTTRWSIRNCSKACWRGGSSRSSSTSIILAIPVMLAAIFIFIFGVITLGLGWVLFWLLSPAAVIWAIVLLRLHVRRPALGHHRHAGHGSGDAHLVRRAGLFRARRRARDRLFWVIDLVPDAADPAGRPLQRPPPAAARHLLGTVVINNSVRAQVARPR